MSTLIDPRNVTHEMIARACDSCVALWIEWMRTNEFIRKHLEKRNVAEWVASAAKNSWVMHDNCDANMVNAEALFKMGLQTRNANVNYDTAINDGEHAFNDAIFMAVTHHVGRPKKEDLGRYLSQIYSMTTSEIDHFFCVLTDAPAVDLNKLASEQ